VRPGRSGFSIIENLIGLLIISIALLVVFELAARVADFNRRQAMLTRIGATIASFEGVIKANAALVRSIEKARTEGNTMLPNCFDNNACPRDWQRISFADASGRVLAPRLADEYYDGTSLQPCPRHGDVATNCLTRVRAFFRGSCGSTATCASSTVEFKVELEVVPAQNSTNTVPALAKRVVSTSILKAVLRPPNPCPGGVMIGFSSVGERLCTTGPPEVHCKPNEALTGFDSNGGARCMRLALVR
jgi:type II secretory pathway pseudopilin PulG